METTIPQLPESLNYIVWIAGIYVVGQFLFKTGTFLKRNGYQRDTDEHIKRFYEVTATNHETLVKLREISEENADLNQRVIALIDQYFRNSIEFRVSVNGKMELMNEKLSHMTQRINDIASSHGKQ